MPPSEKVYMKYFQVANEDSSDEIFFVSTLSLKIILT